MLADSLQAIDGTKRPGRSEGKSHGFHPAAILVHGTIFRLFANVGHPALEPYWRWTHFATAGTPCELRINNMYQPGGATVPSTGAWATISPVPTEKSSVT